jgi:hypothetical protein
MGKTVVKPEGSEETASKEPGYTKQQFLGSVKYKDKKDLLRALLVDDKSYTANEVEQLLNGFLKKEAK